MERSEVVGVEPVENKPCATIEPRHRVPRHDKKVMMLKTPPKSPPWGNANLEDVPCRVLSLAGRKERSFKLRASFWLARASPYVRLLFVAVVMPRRSRIRPTPLSLATVLLSASGLVPPLQVFDSATSTCSPQLPS